MRTLELFAGGGGATLGLKAAGCAAIECLEWEPSAVKTLTAAGFPGRECDLSAMTDADWDAWRAAHGSPDLLWASPPCQAFSQAGKRLGATDARNGWPWTLRAIDGVGPTWALCENVPGLLQHSADHCGDVQRCPGCYWRAVIVPAFRERFASVQVWTLNAANFGVPQTRRRVFLVAGPRPVRCPEASHAKPGQTVGLFGTLSPWVSIGEALGLLAIGGGHNPSYPGDVRRFRDLTDGPSTTIAAEASGNAGPWVVAQSALSQSQRTLDATKPATTLDCGITGGGSYRAPHVYAERPSPAVVCSEVKGSGKGGKPEKLQRASDALFLATGRRRLTVAECAVLQGFPVDHPFQGTKGARYRQVGNAVPPKFAELLARACVSTGRRYLGAELEVVA